MQHLPDSPYAVRRLLIALTVMTIGNGGMYAVVTVLPAVQAEFGVARADASLPFTMLMIGFGVGAMLMGRLADRFGVVVPVTISGVSLGIGYALSSLAPNIWTFALWQGLFIGLLGSSALFAPLIADTSLWFDRRRGIAVGVCASGNYLAGALWPPVTQHFVEQVGWRTTYLGMGVFCAAAVLVLATFMRERPPAVGASSASSSGNAGADPKRPFGFSTATATALLCIAGVACCVAMSMPQVHIVALCADLGFGTARGAQMLAVMLAFGIVSRLVSGYICDHIGGLRTLVLGSALQGIALLLFLPADSMTSLFIVSALFGLFQGGIVPAYAIIVREHFPAAQAGTRVGIVIMFTLFGMALGGWMSGKAYDLTGTYTAAFVNGIGWNALNLTIALYLLWRVRRDSWASAAGAPRTAVR